VELVAQQQLYVHTTHFYPPLILFSFAVSAYIVFYYRWLLPILFSRRVTAPLLAATGLYLWLGSKLNIIMAVGAFRLLPMSPPLVSFFHLSLNQTVGSYLKPLFSDVLIFSCVGIAQILFKKQVRYRQADHERLILQMAQIKAQLQPHFLFNNLNSIYSLSLIGSPKTPRFILLVSELIRYALYESNKNIITLSEEVTFLENYFELEQYKYELANISFIAMGDGLTILKVPPLLLLPLVDNSFKHGRHRFTDSANVVATLTATLSGRLHFVIENDMLPKLSEATLEHNEEIELQNLRYRLSLEYPDTHKLCLSEHDGCYRAELTLQL
jgi:two-component system sensor histidine kinase AlgZ